MKGPPPRIFQKATLLKLSVVLAITLALAGMLICIPIMVLFFIAREVASDVEGWGSLAFFLLAGIGLLLYFAKRSVDSTRG